MNLINISYQWTGQEGDKKTGFQIVSEINPFGKIVTVWRITSNLITKNRLKTFQQESHFLWRKSENAYEFVNEKKYLAALASLHSKKK